MQEWKKQEEEKKKKNNNNKKNKNKNKKDNTGILVNCQAQAKIEALPTFFGKPCEILRGLWQQTQKLQQSKGCLAHSRRAGDRGEVSEEESTYSTRIKKHSLASAWVCM